MLSSSIDITEVTPHLSLNKPEQYDQNVLHIDVTYKGKPLGIQSPRLSFEHTDEQQIRVLFEGKTPEKVSSFYYLFTQLDDYISLQTEETLRKHITSEITTKDLWTSIAQPPKLLGQPPYMDIIIFEGTTPQNLDTFPSFGIGTFILALKHIVVTPTSARAVWGVAECLVHLPKMSIPTGRMSIKEPAEKPVEEPEIKLDQMTVELG